MVKITGKMQKVYALVAAVFLVICTGTVHCPAAESTPAAESVPAVVLEDKAGLLSEDEIAWLKEEAQTVADKSGFNMILGTCDDAAGKTVREVCDDFFDTYTNGDDGVSCIIDMDNREISIRAMGKAIFYLPDDRIEIILDESYNAIAEGDYAECLYAMVCGAADGYDSGIPQDLEIYDEGIRLSLSDVFIALGAALVAGALVFSIIVGKYKLKWGTYRYDFHDSGKLTLTREDDRFVNQVVTHRHIPKNDGNSSGGSGGGSRSSVSRGSSGRVSSGGSRKF